jgi:two-component system OmpR family response regulator
VDENTATILILHSASVVRSVLREILERAGYLIRAAGDLGTAVDMVKEYPPDLLVTDLYISEISGHDAAEYLRKKCPTMRVLLVAGLPQDERIEVRSTGEGYEVFPNPFTSDELVEKVRTVLRTRRRAAG